jgi:nucleolar pre-ribosomal-associated protein 1
LNITLFSALEAFVSAAKKLPQEDVCDVVEGFIKISVECAEVFQLLSGEKRPESEVCCSLPMNATMVIS